MRGKDEMQRIGELCWAHGPAHIQYSTVPLSYSVGRRTTLYAQ